MRLSLILAASLGLAACGGPGQAKYKPYRAEYLSIRPVVRRAAVAYEGDIQTLSAVGGVYLGLLGTKNEEAAVVRGAQHGGTHVVLVKETTYTVLTGANCTTTAVAPNSLSTNCTNTSVNVPSLQYALFRVEPGAWSSLPPALAVSGACEAAPALPAGCEYTHRDRRHSYNGARWYNSCTGEDVSAQLEGKCPID